MKKIVFAVAVLLTSIGLFAQSAEYTKYLNEAKQYEAEKRWCFALGSYYDAMATGDAPELKQEACDGYNELKGIIESGNPGKGKFNIFTIHDEWKDLLIDAEKYGSLIPKYELEIGDLVQGALNYATRTASYSAGITRKISDRYEKTISVIDKGYSEAFKNDWIFDLPKPDDWPLNSVSSQKNNVYNVDGALVFNYEWYDWWSGVNHEEYENAFEAIRSNRTLYDYKFNIVDESGKEIVEGKRFLLETSNYEQSLNFDGIPPDVMELIDNGNAFVNPVAVYLEYGKYNSADDKGGRTFIKNFPEVSLDLDKAVFLGKNQKGDVKENNVKATLVWKEEDEKRRTIKSILDDFKFVYIPGQNYSMSATEVTQKFYEAVMGENPSHFKAENIPVEMVSWYDAVYFCNELSKIENKTPVYSVNGSTDVNTWGYTPHKGNIIDGTVEQDTTADGYRLPTEEEWLYAAKGGEHYKYSGSNNLDEVSWYHGNSNDKTHPIAQKKANGYGLYDMIGNVREWWWDSASRDNIYRYSRGGSWKCYDRYCEMDDRDFNNANDQYNDLGFRIVCYASEINLKKETINFENSKSELELTTSENVEVEDSRILPDDFKKDFVKIPSTDIYMLKSEVTQELYKNVMGDNPSHFKAENNPVERVSWYDAVYFCNELSKIDNKTPVYSVNGSTDIKTWKYKPNNGNSIDGTVEQDTTADGYRLPTEKEWIYAAKGGKNYKYSGSNNLDEVGWYVGNSNDMTHPVAQKKANGYGLYDMSGNVCEWCWEMDLISTGSRYYRGGGYNIYGKYRCEVEQGCIGSADNQYDDMGFRIVCSAKTIQVTQVEDSRSLPEDIKNDFVKIPDMDIFMLKTEVTQKLYESVMGENPSYNKGDNNPVESVSWYDAIYFCNKLSGKFGYTPVYSVNGNTNPDKWGYTPHHYNSIKGNITENTNANGFRLPTEAEWEYAARGGQNYTYAGSNNLNEVGWYSGNSGNKTHPVAQKKANGYGLYDMSGNVWEWCWDVYPYSSNYRYNRGGSYRHGGSGCEVGDRSDSLARSQYDYLGFRIVCSASNKAKKEADDYAAALNNYAAALDALGSFGF